MLGEDNKNLKITNPANNNPKISYYASSKGNWLILLKVDFHFLSTASMGMNGQKYQLIGGG